MKTEDIYVEHVLDFDGCSARVFVQSRQGGQAEGPACALVFGDPKDDCLVRIHSRCLYGDSFGAIECDCGEQLKHSLRAIRTEGSGIVIYLDQEGRGAGLLAKACGYRHSQATGDDTFAAYAALNLVDDSRSYLPAADFLDFLGIRRVRLLTNNPGKVAFLEARGLFVKPEPLVVPASRQARAYLEAKRRHGHVMPLDFESVDGPSMDRQDAV